MAGLELLEAEATTPLPSPRTKSTNEPFWFSVWMTLPARRVSPTLSGCQTLLPVVKRAWPLMRTTLARSCFVSCAETFVMRASTIVPASTAETRGELFFIVSGLEV